MTNILTIAYTLDSLGDFFMSDRNKIHDLKCLDKFYDEVIADNKPFEIRYNDRDYKKGDVLLLNEINEAGVYTGRKSAYQVLYTLTDSEFGGLRKGFIVMGIYPVSLPPTNGNRNDHYHTTLNLEPLADKAA